MSSINDALRRVKRVPDAAGVPGLPLTAEFQNARRGSARRWLGIGLGVIIAAVLVWVFWPGSEAGKDLTAGPAEPASTRPVKTAKPVPGSAAVVPPSPKTRTTPPPAAPPAPKRTAVVKPPPPPPPAPEKKPKPDGRSAIDHYRAGRAAEDRGRFDQAARQYLAAIEADPRMTRAFINLGGIYFFEYQKIDRAREMFDAALSLEPKNKLVHNNLGVLHLQQGRLDQAETHLAAAVELDPDFVDAWYNMACLAARRGMEALAMAHLERAAALHPEAAVWAAGDEDLRSLRHLPEFQEYVKSAGHREP